MVRYHRSVWVFQIQSYRERDGEEPGEDRVDGNVRVGDRMWGSKMIDMEEMESYSIDTI